MSHFLAQQFSKDHATRGQSFYDSVALSCKDKTLFHLINQGKAPTLDSLRANYGHWPSTETFTWEEAQPELAKSVTEQEEQMVEMFDRLNNLDLEGAQRHRLVYTEAVGGILALSIGDEAGAPPFIFTAGAPTASKLP